MNSKECSLIGPITQLVTMGGLPTKGHISDDQLRIEENCGILIDGGKIVEVGRFSDLQKKGYPLQPLGSPAVAIPGLIDSHTHLCYGGSRAADYALRLSGKSYQEIAAAGGGILDSVKKTREATKKELVSGMLKRLRQLLAVGITTCEVKSGYGLSLDGEIKMLEAIANAAKHQSITLVPTCLAAHTLPWEFKEQKEYLDFICNQLLPLVQAKKLSSRIDIFVEENAFSVEEARSYLQRVKGMGFSLTMHADQFSRGGALLAGELQALSADHLEASTDEDLKALAKGGVIPTVLPGASLGLGLPFAPAHRMLDYNLPLVIASDWNPGSAPMGDLLTQAALLGAAEKLTMAETLAAITTRAAAALSLSDRGALLPGVRADLAIFPCGDYREILYYQGALKPSSLFIEGKRVWSRSR